MKPVKDVLEEKGYDIWTIDPDAFVFDAIKLMAEKGVGALLVLKGEKLFGIVSERDYTRKVILKGKSSQKTLVKDIMTEEVISADVDYDIKKCMVLMTTKGIRHLPIKQEEKLVGIVSLGDLVKTIIAEQESKIRGFEKHFQYRSDLPQ
jgi:CBS domain-containing protein